MKGQSKNRILYAAGAVVFIALFVGDGIDMTMQWNNYTVPMVIRTSIHMLAWLLITWYCVNEFQVRQRKSKERHS